MLIKRFEKTIYTLRVLAIIFLVLLGLFFTIKGQAFVYDVEGPSNETWSGNDFSAEIEKQRDRDQRPDIAECERVEADRGFEKGNFCIN